MNIDLHIPRRGDRVSAAHMARILAEIRANRILQSPGIRVSRGPHGTHILFDVPKRASSAAADKGCWRIVAEAIEAEVDGETVSTVVHYIDRQYYQAGGILQQGSDRTTLESFVEASTPFIAARIGYGKSGAENPGYGVQLRGYGSLAEMQADSLVKTYSLIPLYELQPPESAGAEEEDKPIPVIVKTDFRAIPVAQAFEMPITGV